MNFPAPTDENTPGGQWLRKLLRACLASRILPGLGYMVKRTPDGTFLEIRPGSGGSFEIGTFRFKSMQSQHIVCRSWDGDTEGSDDINIGKDPALWFSVTSETLRGDVITYSNYSLTDQSRRASNPTKGIEVQLITRPYVVNDLIWAMKARSFSIPTEGLEVEAEWIDMNRAGRSWLSKT